MQFATSVSTLRVSGRSLTRALLALGVGVLLLVGSVPAVDATESNGKGPDITELKLDRYGADIAGVNETADFQMLGEPSIVAAVGQYLAGPHDVAGGDEGRSFPASPSNDRTAAIFHLCEIDVTLQLTSECR